MVVHIFPKEKFTKPYVDFINDTYEIQKHNFIIYGNYVDESFDKSQYPNVNCYSSKKDVLKSKEVKALLKDANTIVLHAYTDLVTSLVIMNPCVAKKAVVVFWGADIYVHRDVLKKKVNLKARILDMLKGIGLKRCVLFLTFAHDDYKLAQKWFGIKGEHFDILYPSTVDKEEVERIYNTKQKNDCINVLLGNSATKTNQHMAALDMLKDFSDENIELYVPLSYGDMEYKDNVIREGEKIFKNKFHAITDFMTPEQYSIFLSKMDVALFNNDRQQATGNIELLAYFGAKIYIRSDTVMWKHYVKNDNCVFFDIEEIRKQSFEEFYGYDIESQKDNHDYFSMVWDKQHLVDIWDRVFDYMEMKNGKK